MLKHIEVLLWTCVLKWQGKKEGFQSPTVIDGCPEQMSACGNAGNVTWPETEIGQEVSIPCPCGVDDPLIQKLRGTRRCGGTYDTGAMWEEPQCSICQFSDTRLTLCQLAEVVSLSCMVTQINSMAILHLLTPVCVLSSYRSTAQIGLPICWSVQLKILMRFGVLMFLLLWAYWTLSLTPNICKTRVWVHGTIDCHCPSSLQFQCHRLQYKFKLTCQLFLQPAPVYTYVFRFEYVPLLLIAGTKKCSVSCW